MSEAANFFVEVEDFAPEIGELLLVDAEVIPGETGEALEARMPAAGDRNLMVDGAGADCFEVVVGLR